MIGGLISLTETSIAVGNVLADVPPRRHRWAAIAREGGSDDRLGREHLVVHRLERLMGEKEPGVELLWL